MSRGNMSHVHIFIVQLVGKYSVLIDSDWETERAVQPIDTRGLMISRVLNGVGKTASKKLHQQVIEVFSTSSDDYPVRRYRYSTVASQVSRDSRLKLRSTARRNRSKYCAPFFKDHRSH